jgi:ubiquinone/menaquinone biosynthesis C-methylase UbiE
MKNNPNKDTKAIKEDIRQKYNKFARWYDLAGKIPELLGLRRLRRSLLRHASGRVLEVAVGTGKNLQYYPKNCGIMAVDLSPAMLGIARKRVKKLGLDVSLLVMDVENLAFRDGSFDTVVDSMGLCTFPDPIAVLREMARVCRPEGKILLLEHGRSDREWLGGWQDRRADQHAKLLGCRWNREPLELVRQAGLRIISARRTFFGTIHLIEAMP